MRKKFNDSKFLIVGLARNCEKIIYDEVNRINDCFKDSISTKWLIIESDSTDNTIHTLEKLSFELRLKYISLGNLRYIYPKRTERIAVCRNHYLKEINHTNDYKDIDYVVVVDLDGVNLLLTASSLKSCWKLTVDWDACFANQLAPYYDVWALRHKVWSPNDCWKQRQFLMDSGINKFDANLAAVWSRMIEIDNKAPPIEVESAFGGLGIYKKNIFGKSTYNGIDNNGHEVCEHVSFNQELRNGGSDLYIVPSLINCAWNEHNSDLKFYNKIKSRIKSFLNSGR